MKIDAEVVYDPKTQELLIRSNKTGTTIVSFLVKGTSVERALQAAERCEDSPSFNQATPLAD